MRSIHGGSAPWSDTVAVLDGLAGEDVTAWSDAQVHDGVLALLRAHHQLTAALSAVVASFDTRGLADSDGYKATRSWLCAFGWMSQGAATGWLRRGRLQRDLPELGAAARAGDVSAEQLRRVDDLCTKLGTGPVREYDTILADVAAESGLYEVGVACDRIRALVDPDGPEPDPHAHDRRELTLSRQGSLVQVRGQLDLEGAAVVHTALDAWLTPPTPDDVRTAAQRRADALVEVLRQALTRGELPTVGGVRPQLGLLLTPETLQGLRSAAFNPVAFNPAALNPVGGPPASGPLCGIAGVPLAGSGVGGLAVDYGPPTGVAGTNNPPLGPAPTGIGVGGSANPLDRLPPGPEPPWLNWVGTIPTTTAQRLACDSDIWRIVLDPATGLPLELGRTHRLVPHWIRKALHARDRGCRWPGCLAAPSWTDAHHLLAWYYDNGQTNIDELLSLCRHHHMRVHEDGWTAHLDPTTGDVWITRPDGTPYELGPSHPWHPTTTHQRP